jgi:hypothetical protein
MLICQKNLYVPHGKDCTGHYEVQSHGPSLHSENIPCTHIIVRIRDNVVGIATGYGLDDREIGVRIPIGSRIFTFLCRPDQLWGSPGGNMAGV